MGEIRDFRQPNQGHHREGKIQIITPRDGVRETTPVEVTRYEEIVIEDDVRNEPRKPNEPEVRIRLADNEGWKEALKEL